MLITICIIRKHILSSFCLILLSDISPTFQSILSLSWFVHLGKMSFGMYLVHCIFLPFIKLLLAFGIKSGVSKNLAFPISAIIYFSIVFIISHLFYNYVDRITVIFCNKMVLKFLRKGNGVVILLDVNNYIGIWILGIGRKKCLNMI